MRTTIPSLPRLTRWLRRQAAVGRHQTRIASWLVRDILRFSRWDSLRVILIEFAGLAVRYGSMGLLYVFVHALAENQPFEVPFYGQIELPVRDFFVLGVLVGIGLLSLSALLQFVVRSAALQMADRYERFCGRRMLALASRLPSQKAAWASRIFGREPINVFFAYARTCGTATRQMALLLPSLVSLIVGASILLWLDALSTVILATLAVLVFLAQFPLNNVSAQASSRTPRRRREAMRVVSRLLVRQRSAPLPLQEDGAILRHLFAKRGEVRQDIALYRTRLRSGEGAMLVQRIGGNLMLGVALLLIGGDVLTGERSWGQVAVYVVVIRYVLKDFLAIGKFRSVISRQFGPLERYIRFVRSAAQADAEPVRAAPADGPLVLRARALAGEGPLVLGAGGVTAVVSRDRNLPLGMLLMDHVEPPGTQLGPVGWIDAELLLGDASLATNLALPVGADLGGIEAAALAMGAPDDAPPYRPGWLSRPMARLPSPPPDWLICALKVVVAEYRGSSCLAIEVATLAGLPASWRPACLRAFRRGPLLVLHRELRSIGRHGETQAVFVDGTGLVGWLPLSRATTKLVAQHYGRLSTRPDAAGQRSDEDEELVEGV